MRKMGHYHTRSADITKFLRHHPVLESATDLRITSYLYVHVPKIARSAMTLTNERTNVPTNEATNTLSATNGAADVTSLGHKQRHLV